MKVIRKLSSPIISENGVEKTAEVVFCDDLFVPLSELENYDKGILNSIPISESQKVFFSSRGRTFFAVSYLPKSVLLYSCEHCGALHFEFIEHNKDVTSTGDLKKPHFHVLLYFEDLTTLSRVVYWLRCVEVRIVSTESVTREHNYLTHNSEQCRKEHKVPYNESEIISDDLSYWKRRCIGGEKDLSAVDMWDDFCRGLSFREMLSKYGYKYLTYYKILCSVPRDIVSVDCNGVPQYSESEIHNGYIDRQGHLIIQKEI